MEIGLLVVFLLVLVLPLFIHRIERQIEFFLLLMGFIAARVSDQWSMHLMREASIEPVPITVAVLIFGLLFSRARSFIDRHVSRIKDRLGIRLFIIFLVVILGLISSIVTAILASLLLSEVIGRLKMDRKSEVRIAILACFSIGLGAVLTPIGEPLSTIVISKLRSDPYHADFFFLFRHLGLFIFPAVLAVGAAAGLIIRRAPGTGPGLKERARETLTTILIRTAKVYVFVFGLILLGSAYKPVIDRFISEVPFSVLYWFNILSAVLDNATLAAAEIGPCMSLIQIKAAILALAVAGGMLIPGNIPNIITAGKLGIRSREWMRFGVPFGLLLLVVYYLVLIIFG
jgi:predicted cation transporter